jgi:hypothetical protein
MDKVIEVEDEFSMTVSGVAKNPPVNSHIQFDLLLPYSFSGAWS